MRWHSTTMLIVSAGATRTPTVVFFLEKKCRKLNLLAPLPSISVPASFRCVIFWRRQAFDGSWRATYCVWSGGSQTWYCGILYVFGVCVLNLIFHREFLVLHTFLWDLCVLCQASHNFSQIFGTPYVKGRWSLTWSDMIPERQVHYL